MTSSMSQQQQTNGNADSGTTTPQKYHLITYADLLPENQAILEAQTNPAALVQGSSKRVTFSSCKMDSLEFYNAQIRLFQVVPSQNSVPRKKFLSTIKVNEHQTVSIKNNRVYRVELVQNSKEDLETWAYGDKMFIIDVFFSISLL